MQETKLKCLCLNGIGKTQNILWQTNIFELINENNLNIYYDINNKSSDDINIIEKEIKTENIEYIKLNEYDLNDLFVCDTIDNIINYRLNSFRNIKGCFFGGIKKDNFNAQMELLNAHDIEFVISDIFPDELIDNGFTCSKLFIKIFNFIEPVIPETCVKHKTNNSECILFTDNNNKKSIDTLISSFCSSREIIPINIRNEDFDIISINPLTCKRILFNGNYANIYHAIARFSLKHNISLKSLNEIKLSSMRKIHLCNDGLFFEVNNSKVKNLKYSIREIFKYINNTDKEYVFSPSKLNKKNILLENISAYKENLINYPIKRESLNICDDLFINDRFNSIRYIECLLIIEKLNSIKLDINSHKVILKRLLAMIAKKPNSETQNFYIYQLINANNDVFINNITEILNELSRTDKNNLISSIFNTITKTKIDKNISERILNIIVSETNNPLLLSRIRLILHGTKDYEKFFKSTQKTLKSNTSTYLLSSTISAYLNYYNESSAEDIGQLHILLDKSPEYPDARSLKLFCLCRIYIRTKRYDDIVPVLQAYKSNHPECRKFNNIIIETMFTILNHVNKRILLDLLNLININNLTSLESIAILTFKIILGLTTNNYDLNNTKLSKDLINYNLVSILLYLRILNFLNHGKLNEAIEKKLSVFTSEKISNVKDYLQRTEFPSKKNQNIESTLDYFENILNFNL